MSPEREVETLKRRLALSNKYWIRAAKAAIAGDMRELQNRVEMHEAEPQKVVLSES